MEDARRTTVAAIGMIGAPLAFFLGTVVHPGLRSDEGAQLALIADNADRWYLTHVLGLIAVALFIPAILGVVGLVRKREPLWADVGGALSLVGLLGWTGIVVIFGFVLSQMADVGDRGEMAALFERLNEEPEAVMPLRLLSFAFALGMVVLAVGLARSRVVRPWPALLFAPAFPLFAFGGLTSRTWVLTVATALMVAGLGSIGVSLLRPPDEESHAPE